MRDFKKVIIILLLVVLMSLNVSESVFAQGTVTYDGKANEFIFEPGSTQSPTDLFERFKDVMPGDTITQQIEVKNASSDLNAKIYLRSMGAKAESEKFLSQITLTVKQKDNAILFEAPADQTAQLTDWVCIGTISPDGKAILDLTLEIPITLGNEFQDAAGYLDWQFKVETYPAEGKVPTTGDVSHPMFWFLIMGIAALAVTMYIPYKKLHNRQR